MDKLLIVILLAWVGLLFGSFAGAQVWRLRARQLAEDKRDKEPVDAVEFKRLKPLLRPVSTDRSECLNCHHQLAWFDLIPLVSWASTLGRCRYCRAKIGWFEPLMEIGMATLFVVSYLFWPHPLTSSVSVLWFGMWLVACVLMMILFAYDSKWSLLPFEINISFIVVSAVFLVVGLLVNGVDGVQLLSTGGAVLILGGLYFLFSLCGWVGMGDGILGIGLGLLLGDWKLAFLALFLANFFGCLMLLPIAIRGKLHRGARIPFGPFLIVGTISGVLWGNEIINFAFGSLVALSL
jgi:prepilin signal peptidase PulO-like enzyme (type II secretory pathway)